jgi:hypothetical protein
MIVDPTFTKHWKTKRLIRLLKDAAAPVYVINLWAHCQVSKKPVLDVPACAIAEICDYDGDPDAFVKALLACGFVEKQGDRYVVHQWADYNNNLVANWDNGRRGGRPRTKAKTQPETQPTPDESDETQGELGMTGEEPNDDSGSSRDNPNRNRVNPPETETQFGQTDRRIEGEKEGKKNSPLPPLNGGNDDENFSDSSPQTPDCRISWTPESGWRGIDDAAKARWRAAYPACDLERQLAAMDTWLRANSKRAHKSNWERFIVNWLTKQQDRGGDVRNAPREGGSTSGAESRKPLSTWAIKERLEACQNEYNDIVYPGGSPGATELSNEKRKRAEFLLAQIKSLRSQLTRDPNTDAKAG